jgi:hypothetical protein
MLRALGMLREITGRRPDARGTVLVRTRHAQAGNASPADVPSLQVVVVSAGWAWTPTDGRSVTSTADRGNNRIVALGNLLGVSRSCTSITMPSVLLASSALGVIVMAAPPDARLVAPLGRAIEPLACPRGDQRRAQRSSKWQARFSVLRFPGRRNTLPSGEATV